MKMKTVLVADIVMSRKIEDRYQVQKDLMRVLDFLNICYQDEILREVEISTGDSFQGLFDNSTSAFLYLRMVQLIMHPVKIRAGIGVGDLDYLDDSFSSNQLDGAAYHNARTAINNLSLDTRGAVSFSSNRKEDININLMLDMFLKLKDIWGGNSARITLLNELLNPMSLYGNINYLADFNQELSSIVTTSLNESFVNYNWDIYIELMYSHEYITLAINEINNESLDNSRYILRGIQKPIADIIGTTRQNVQKYFANSVADERMYAAEIATLLGKRMV